MISKNQNMQLGDSETKRGKADSFCDLIHYYPIEHENGNVSYHI